MELSNLHFYGDPGDVVAAGLGNTMRMNDVVHMGQVSRAGNLVEKVPGGSGVGTNRRYLAKETMNPRTLLVGT